MKFQLLPNIFNRIVGNPPKADSNGLFSTISSQAVLENGGGLSDLLDRGLLGRNRSIS